MKKTYKQQEHLSSQDIERTKRASVAEGSASSLMLGFGEQYIVPFALRLGASGFQIGILSSLPHFIGSLFQLLGARLVEQYPDRKVIVRRAVLAQALTLIPLFIIPFLTKSVIILTVIFCLYLALGNLFGPAWNSWIGDVIPQHQRAEYFGRRNKAVTGALFLSVLGAGLLLHHFERTDIWLGFSLLFGIALIGRLASFFLFSRHEEPRLHPSLWNDFTLREFLLNIKKTDFGNFVVFRTSTSFAVMIAAPFFAVYMLTHLGFSYMQYSMVVLVPMFVKALTVTYWGGFSKVFGNKAIMQVCSILIGFIPFNWFLAALLVPDAWLFPTILIIECVSGFAWAGFELTTFNYMLDQSTPSRRARLFAYYTVMMGFMVFVGGLVGSLLLKLFTMVDVGIKAMLAVFIVSGVLRLLVSVLLMPRVKDVGNHVKVAQKRVFYEVLVHRPFGQAANGLISRMIIVDKTIRSLGKKEDWPDRKKKVIRK